MSVDEFLHERRDERKIVLFDQLYQPRITWVGPVQIWILIDGPLVVIGRVSIPALGSEGSRRQKVSVSRFRELQGEVARDRFCSYRVAAGEECQELGPQTSGDLCRLLIHVPPESWPCNIGHAVS